MNPKDPSHSQHSRFPPAWDGSERRNTPEHEELWEIMQEIRDSLKEHLAQEAIYQPKMLEVIDILERSKGVIMFFKVLIYVGAPVTAFWAWAKDHIKL